MPGGAGAYFCSWSGPCAGVCTFLKEVSMCATVLLLQTLLVNGARSQGLVSAISSWNISDVRGHALKLFEGPFHQMARKVRMSTNFDYVLSPVTHAINRGVLRGTLHIGVLGGSVSAGGDCWPGQNYIGGYERLPRKLMAVAMPAVKIKVWQGSVGATNSWRGWLCYDSIFPDPVDIVIIEYGINDATWRAEPWFELLIRSLPLLTVPIVLDVFSERYT